MKKYVLLALLLLLGPALALAEDKRVYGYRENVRIPEISNRVIRAKLDSGALTSSLGAENIVLFERDGEEWVRFTPQLEAASEEIERPLLRHSLVKLRPTESLDGSHARPVVELAICFDGDLYLTEVNLTDRSRFNAPLLLGRRALIEFDALIDPSAKHLSTPDCK